MLNIMSSSVIQSVTYAECRYAECRYAECRYAECRYAECRYAECRYAECRGATRLVYHSRYNYSTSFSKRLKSIQQVSMKQIRKFSS
jgi:hypothetical protein